MSSEPIVNRTFFIFAEKKDDVYKQIKKLNKRAVKLSLPPIELHFGSAYVEKVHTGPDADDGIFQDLLKIPVTVSGPIYVKYNDWEFIASLLHLPTGDNIVSSISEIEIPEKYRNVGCNCDHCNTLRKRNNTYILYNKDKQEYKQVGSTCVKDFLGHNSPDIILAQAELVSDLYSCMDAAESYSGGGKRYWDIKSFLIITMIMIRKYGWLSKTQANSNGGTPTSIRVFEYKKASDGDSTKDEIEYVEKVIEWCENLSDEQVLDNDYLFNIRAIVRAAYVEYKTAGFAASIIMAYKKAMEEIKEKESKKPSEYVGDVGERAVFELIFDRKIDVENSAYMTITHMCFFKDVNDNIFLWKTSTYPRMEEGKKYYVTGRIKAHSEYKGIKQTILTRCSLEEIKNV